MTQELDVWGKQSARRDAADAAMRQSSLGGEAQRLQTRAEVRLGLMTASSLTEAMQSNAGTLAHLRRIRGASAGFVDPRMGYYANTVFNSDLAGIESDLRDLKEARDKALLQLHRLIGIKEEIKPPAPEEIPLPPAPALTELLNRAHEKNPERLAANLALARAESNERLAMLGDRPNPSLFLGAGQNTIGTSNLGLKGPGPENERERTFRFGAKIPIPISKYNDGALEAARQEKRKAAMDLERIETQLDFSVKQTAERYTAYREAICEIGPVGDSGSNLAAIDQAFLAGRISYFDFMGEYERTAKVLKRRADSYIGAAASLGALELLTGQTLDKEQE
ncbi:MAG: TolC family protein [Leptospirales bacterium]|nr:TolC family protein [Leptospirales bacterium]